MPTICICSELYREIKAIRDKRIKNFIELTGMPRGMVDGWTSRECSWESCSRELLDKYKKIKCYTNYYYL